MTATMTTTENLDLTAADRCDRCGAAALVRVTLSSGGELLFCGHHATAHADKIAEIGASIYDQRLAN